MSPPCDHVSGMTPSERRAYLAEMRRMERLPWYSEPFTELQEWIDHADGGMRQHDILNQDGRSAKVLRPGDRKGQGKRRHHDLGRDEEALSGGGFSITYGKPDTPLPRLPFEARELREAISARRHRSGEQKLIVDVFRVYLAKYKPHDETLANALGCGKRTIERYRSEGSKLLEELTKEVKLAVKESVHEEHERQLTAILTALGIDPIRDAEKILENAA